MPLSPRRKIAECVPVLATDPLYILYTSGTTGIPKGVVRDNGGHLVALKWSMKNLYDVDPGEVWWCGSDIGWVVGHSYIVYAPLFHGATSIMYEGKPVGTPDAGAYWRVISQHKAASLLHRADGVSRDQEGRPRRQAAGEIRPVAFPHAVSGRRARRSADHRMGRRESCTSRWCDHWWQTETGWCIAGNPVGLGMLPVKHGSATVPMPGWDIRVVDESNKEVPAGTIGSLVAKLPMPPGAFPTLWQQDERFRETYLAEFPGYYKNRRCRLQG